MHSTLVLRSVGLVGWGKIKLGLDNDWVFELVLLGPGKEMSEGRERGRESYT